MSRLSHSTAQRLETPLRSRGARYMAIRNARKEIALVYVDAEYENIVAATKPGSDREPLVSVVRDGATTFRERDMRNGSGPFAAANVRPAQLDVHKGPTRTRSAKIVRGGLPGLGRRTQPRLTDEVAGGRAAYARKGLPELGR